MPSAPLTLLVAAARPFTCSSATATTSSHASCSPPTEPLDALLTIVLRAGVRTPTPSGLRSALRAAHGLVAQHAPPPSVAPVVDVDADPVHVVIRIGVDERWCAHCGTVTWWTSSRETGKANPCCSRPQPVPVKTFLHPEEYLEER